MDYNTPTTAEIFAQQFKTLPKDVKRFIIHSPTEEVVRKVAHDFSLSEEHTASLFTVVSLLMFGLLDPLSFVTTIRDTLDIPLETAEEIANLLNDTILEPALPALIEYQASLEALDPPDQQLIGGSLSSADESSRSVELSKDAVLDEIENPQPSPVRKIPIEEALGGTLVGVPRIGVPHNLPGTDQTPPMTFGAYWPGTHTPTAAARNQTPQEQAGVSGAGVPSVAQTFQQPQPTGNAFLPRIKTMPHNTQEAVVEEARQVEVQRQVNKTFIEQKLTQTQKNTSVSPVLPTKQQSPVRDPYREPTK